TTLTPSTRLPRYPKTRSRTQFIQNIYLQYLKMLLKINSSERAIFFSLGSRGKCFGKNVFLPRESGKMLWDVFRYFSHWRIPILCSSFSLGSRGKC
ncbi:hypothetical protein L9F63_014740, partial [Diploptera punctata]